MKVKRLFLCQVLCLIITAIPICAEMVTTEWKGNGVKVYETGFMQHLMRHEKGVCLFNMECIENDAAGAGMSEKGVWYDEIWGKNRARKLFYLDDPRSFKVWVVVCIREQGEYPLQISLNGNESQIKTWMEKQKSEWCRWIDFPQDVLKKGKNVVELSCSQAETVEKGWKILIARADEFEDGGGDPRPVGETSFKSFDGGKSWKINPFGPQRKTRAEYSVRLSLDRYVPVGWLATPVIDLWKGDSKDFIVPLRMLRKLSITAAATVPEGAEIKYYLRKGTAPGPFDGEWEPYEYIGEGQLLDLTLDGDVVNRRYIQLKAVLSSTNPLVSPVVDFVHVTAQLEEYVPLPRNIQIVSTDNSPIQYSSIDWEWEKWDRPEFSELREWESLDDVIVGSTTQFNAQVKILDHASKRWLDGNPVPEYPFWDAISILNRIDKAGSGGMCIQNNNYLAGLYQVFGWQARLVNISHEVCEVWNDEFGKWIYMDAHRVNQYMYDEKTAEPQSVLDLHKGYLDKYYPDHPVNWMEDYLYGRSMDDTFPVKRGSLTHHKPYAFNAFNMAAQIRMVPRNNWFEKPTPRPLTHGLTQWPWNGYINWYDDRTPPNRKYSWFTDRPRDLWPDLNKVHIDAKSGSGNDRLAVHFETYTPNFSHFEVDVNDTGWKRVGKRWMWILQSGRNTLRARAVSKLGTKGKQSVVILNYADAQHGDYRYYK